MVKTPPNVLQVDNVFYLDARSLQDLVTLSSMSSLTSAVGILLTHDGAGNTKGKQLFQALCTAERNQPLELHIIAIIPCLVPSSSCIIMSLAGITVVCLCASTFRMNSVWCYTIQLPGLC